MSKMKSSASRDEQTIAVLMDNVREYEATVSSQKETISVMRNFIEEVTLYIKSDGAITLSGYLALSAKYFGHRN